jgi:hypothetical protein
MSQEFVGFAHHRFLTFVGCIFPSWMKYLRISQGTKFNIFGQFNWQIFLRNRHNRFIFQIKNWNPIMLAAANAPIAHLLS